MKFKETDMLSLNVLALGSILLNGHKTKLTHRKGGCTSEMAG